MSSKVLSIIVPSYNMEQFLPKCLGSLILPPELMEKFEVLIINDGSKDRTSEIAHEYVTKWPETFRVVDKENGHYGSCINVGLEAAQGYFVKVLDADDWFDTQNFELYVEYLAGLIGDGEPPPDVVFSDFEYINPSGKILKRCDYVARTGFDITKFNFESGEDVWMHAVAYRRDILQELSYRQRTGIPHTDVQWIHLPMAMVRKIAYFPKVVYEYWVSREGNTCSPRAFYQTYWALIEVLKTLVDECNRSADAVGEIGLLYLRLHIRYRAMRAYQTYLCEANKYLRPGALHELDDYLQVNSPWLYQEMQMQKFPLFGPYEYVRIWRENGRRLPATMRLGLWAGKWQRRLRYVLTKCHLMGRA